LIWLSISLGNHFYHITGINLLLNLEYTPLFLGGIYFDKLSVEEKSRINIILPLVCYLVYFIIIDTNIDRIFTERLIVLGFFLMFYLNAFNALKFIALKPLIFLGNISYALYLVHQNLSYIILNKLYANFGNYQVLILFFATVFIYFSGDLLIFNYQFNRILEIYNQQISFEISELFYAMSFVFFVVSVYLFVKNKYVEYASSVLNYIKLIFVLLIISGFSLLSGVLISQRILLFIFIFSSIFFTILVITKNNISRLITPILTIIIFITFINNYNYGTWEYASVTKIFSNSLFSYFY